MGFLQRPLASGAGTGRAGQPAPELSVRALHAPAVRAFSLPFFGGGIFGFCKEIHPLPEKKERNVKKGVEAHESYALLDLVSRRF